jgi:hypothetical protein
MTPSSEETRPVFSRKFPNETSGTEDAHRDLHVMNEGDVSCSLDASTRVFSMADLFEKLF